MAPLRKLKKSWPPLNLKTPQDSFFSLSGTLKYLVYVSKVPLKTPRHFFFALYLQPKVI